MKRENTCGSTPNASTDVNDAPVARTASTCLSEISSMASVKSLPMKPMLATVSARTPASAPNPTAFTNRIATITGMKRARGRRSRTAPARWPRPASGCARRKDRSAAARTIPSAEARTAISQAFQQALHEDVPARGSSAGRAAQKKRDALLEARLDARPRDLHLRARPHDVDRERDHGKARPQAAVRTGRAARRGSRQWRPCGRFADGAGRRSVQPALAAVDGTERVHRRAASGGPSNTMRPSDIPTCDRRSASRARRRAC